MFTSTLSELNAPIHQAELLRQARQDALARKFGKTQNGSIFSRFARRAR